MAVENDFVVEISPRFGALAVCQQVQLTATVRDLAGNSVQVDSVRWSSNDTTAALVNGLGLVRAIRPAHDVTIRAVAFRAHATSASDLTFDVSEPVTPAPCP